MGWKLENGPFQLTNLSHIGIAVKDAEQTVKMLSKIWNIASPEIFDYEPKQEELFVGRAFKARLVWFQLGPVRIELLQPLDDRSIWHTFIQEKGEGIHHFAFGVSNYDEMMKKFQAEGHKLLISAIFNGERWCYFDTAPGGTVIELREEYTKKP
jgi:methylmalonyl-CoA/ethylmalonyl-CoA epimerase